MRINLDGLDPEAVTDLARKFKQAPCIVCGRKQVGYQKLQLDHEVAFLPLCGRCLKADRQTLKAAMEMADAAGKPGVAQARRGS